MNAVAPGFYFVADAAKGQIVQPCEITEVITEQNYSMIKLASGAQLRIRRSFEWCEKKLAESRMFFRVRRGHLVNMKFVEIVKPYDPKRYQFLMRGGSSVILSKNSSADLKKMSL